MSTHPAVEAVAELIRTQTRRIEVTPDIVYTVRAPSLLAQLADAIAAGQESGGRGVPGSRPPISVDALDLWIEINTNTYTWADALSVSVRPYWREVPDTPTPPVGRLLRGLAAVAGTDPARQLIADAIAYHARRWTREIAAMLTGEQEQRAVRGAACPVCSATTIVEDRQEDRRTVAYRVPAIVLVVEGSDELGRLRWLVCRACGWTEPAGAAT